MSRTSPPPRRTFRVPTELVLSAVFTLISHAQGQIYCLKEYKASPNHTGCKNANNITAVPTYQRQSFYNDVLLQLFNSYRSSVAVGNCKPFPSAANMLKLEWDNELATLAYLHSAFLINTSNWPLHDEVYNRFTTRFKETGQSVAVLRNTTHRYVSYWNTVIREWFAEYQLVKLAAVRSYDADESTTNVSQMWWAATRYVGCGYSTMLMPNGHDYDHSYVCNFGPAGNVRGSPIYRQGDTCSMCPKETKCEPTTGLCAVFDGPPFPPFGDDEKVNQSPVEAAYALAPPVALIAVTAALRVISYAMDMR
ncbi:scoloptoxin SSD976-like [Rhipicephalus microplus]|uniref:scoloptoxin SSD976-like n=1 Tax=Rhipicephalus microplus TaxID=6941 RepID=UPI003F6B1684